MMSNRMIIAGVEFKVGDKDVETPDGSGEIVDIDGLHARIGVFLYDIGEIRYYSWIDVLP